jgi:hypothetical protein
MGRLAGWQAGRLAGWQAGRLAARLPAWQKQKSPTGKFQSGFFSFVVGMRHPYDYACRHDSAKHHHADCKPIGP